MPLFHHQAGAGEPLVLVHGLGATWRTWITVIPRLAEERRVLAVDLPGFGGSDPLPDAAKPTGPRYADALEGWLDEQGLATVDVAGSSMGGTLALELARRGRARSVCAIAPVGLGTPRENRHTRRRLRLARVLAPAVRPFAGIVSRLAVGRVMMYGLSAARPWRVDPEEMRIIIDGLVESSGFDEALDWFLTNPPTGLEDIRCPVTIAWGSGDRLVSTRQAERFRDRIPGAEVLMLEGLGHVPMPDDPEVVARTILTAAARDAAVEAPS